jgi:tRNA threonylcarbamoyladenosine biosynthesis protein TsaE
MFFESAALLRNMCGDKNVQKTCSNETLHKQSNIKPTFRSERTILERVTGLEPVFTDWQPVVIAPIRYPHVGFMIPDAGENARVDSGEVFRYTHCMKKTMITKSAEETAARAEAFAETLKGGDVVGLIGDLGAGKTTFTQALARAFGVKRNVRSPTFVRIAPYQLPKQIRGVKTFVHIDAYRTSDPRELLDCGLDEYLDRDDALVIIEWADLVRDILPKDSKIILFSSNDARDERLLTFSKK